VVGFEEWVAARGDALFRLAYLLSGSRADAQDAVEDALSRALPGWSRTVRDDDPEAQVTRTLVGRPRSPRGEPAAELPPDDPEDAEHDRVWRACLALPPEERVAVVLRHHARCDDAEIAELTGVDEGVAGARVSGGLATLRTTLEVDDELGTLLPEALDGAADGVPGPVDLAAGARVRLRRRRRTSVAAVAAVVTVAAVPVSVAAVVGDDAPHRGGSTATEEVPSGWRTETWRDLSVSVPPDWGWGGGTDWCTSGRGAAATPPEVSRPGGVVPAIACSPSYGYGAHFLEPSGGELPPGTEGAVQQYRGDHYPDGAWIGYVSTGSAAVWVVTVDRSTTRSVLDSAIPLGAVDANGCTTRFAMAPPSISDRMVVCRYDDDGLLEQSERLSAADTRQAEAAVRAAPPARPATRHCLRAGLLEMPAVTLASSRVNATALYAGCVAVYVPGPAARELTGDVLYWALSPGWSGVLPLGVPSPDRLRTD